MFKIIFNVEKKQLSKPFIFFLNFHIFKPIFTILGTCKYMYLQLIGTKKLNFENFKTCLNNMHASIKLPRCKNNLTQRQPS